MDNWEKDLRKQLGYLNAEDLAKLINNIPAKKANANYVLAPLDNYTCKECSKKDRNFYLAIILMLFVAFGILYNAKTDNSLVNSVAGWFAKSPVVEAQPTPPATKKKPAPKALPKVEAKPKEAPKAQPKPSTDYNSLKKDLEEINKKIELINDKIFALGIQANNNWSIEVNQRSEENIIMLNRDYTLNKMPKNLSQIGPKEQKELNRLVKPSFVK